MSNQKWYTNHTSNYQNECFWAYSDFYCEISTLMTYHVAQLVIKNWNRNIVNLGVLVGQVMAYKLNCHRCKKIDDDIENYRLQMPSENFFQWNSELSGMGRKYWVDKFWCIWGIFGLNYHHHSESLVHVFHYSTIFSTKI